MATTLVCQKAVEGDGSQLWPLLAWLKLIGHMREREDQAAEEIILG